MENEYFATGQAVEYRDKAVREGRLSGEGQGGDLSGMDVKGDCEASPRPAGVEGEVCALGAGKGHLGFNIAQGDGGVEL